jgi:hypothetical protein
VPTLRDGGVPASDGTVPMIRGSIAIEAWPMAET